MKNDRPLPIRPEAPAPVSKPVITEESVMPGVHVLSLFLFFMSLLHTECNEVTVNAVHPWAC